MSDLNLDTKKLLTATESSAAGIKTGEMNVIYAGNSYKKSVFDAAKIVAENVIDKQISKMDII